LLWDAAVLVKERMRLSNPAWKRNLLKAFTGLAFYLFLWLVELIVTGLIRKPIKPLPIYFPEAPYLLNVFLGFLVPALPFMVIGWFYKGRRRDLAVIVAATMFAVFLWMPWLGTISTPIPMETMAKRIVDMNYEVCGIYRTSTGWQTFTYEVTVSSRKDCAFLILRPEPRFNYKLVFLNASKEIGIVGRTNAPLHDGMYTNAYVFYSGGTFAEQFYLTRSRAIRDFPDRLIFGNHTATGFDVTTPTGHNTIADDWVEWFVVSPEPSNVVLRVRYTITVKAVPYTPWS
jgi:hypothetical protein